MQNSITTTTAIATTTSGAGGVVMWALQCITQHALAMPTQETAMFLAALLLPLVHAAGRVVLSLLARLEGTGGKCAACPELVAPIGEVK